MAELTRALDGRPRLVFFFSPRSGPCRRAEGFLAQVLQRRRNHATFALYRVDVLERPDLSAKFGIGRVPALAVVSEGRVRARLEQPRGARAIEQFLAGWLHGSAVSRVDQSPPPLRLAAHGGGRDRKGGRDE